MEKVRIDFRDQIASNKRKSFFLIVIILAIFLLLGYVIGQIYEGYFGGSFFIIMIIAIIISLSYTWYSYYNSDKIAIWSVKAKPASREKHNDFYRLVEGLTIASGLPMPRLFIMNSNQINAFASGRDPQHAVICVTTGALKKLERRELESVLAHELGHIGNYDIRYITLVSVMVGMIAILSELFLRSLWFRSSDNDRGKSILLIVGVLLAILAPIVVHLVRLSISRKREYASDATAVKFTRYPDGLIKALKKIDKDYKAGVTSEKKVNKAVAPMFFANPFKGIGSTHPPIDKRIAALERM